MSALRLTLCLAAAVWLAALAPALSAPASRAPEAVATTAAGQVLVLLRLPPEHFRPNGDYSGGYGDGAGQRARQRVADRLARAYGLTRVDNWPMPVLGVDCFIMDVPAGQSPVQVAERLSKDPSVAWSQPMGVFHTQGAIASHNDPLFRVQPIASEWSLAELHQTATGRNVRVAVIDSRVERTHPDLAGQIEYSEDFVAGRPSGAEIHGTGVAGIIAALADNDIGIAGVAPGSRLMALRACWQSNAAAPTTVCDTLSLAKAIDFAISHNAQVINLSLSGPPDPLLGKLLDVAMSRGAVVVGAFDPDLPGGGFPASHAGIVAVADESQGDLPAGIYNAPGRDVPTTQPGGRWFIVNGSSYAAAHVSGLFALMREKRSLKPGALVLVASRSRGGRIDACATLLRTSRPCICSCAHAAN
ncbi:MAG: S8 family serine peptidase [Caulobacteraceae bacterium]